jgi:hypothetical protein
VAYEMLAGRRPFDAENPLEALTQRLTQSPPPLTSAAPGVDEDLADAIMRCLERQAENRWPDARTLRSAMALFDEGDDPLPIRLLKISMVMAVGTFIAVIYTSIFKGPVAGMSTAIGMAIPFVVFGTGAFAAAKRQKFTNRSIGRLALLQPRWWRFWYPKRFRRRGDVWDRLPRQIRHLRIQMTAAFCALFGIALPTQVGLNSTGGSSAARAAAATFMLACVAYILVARARMTRYVSRLLDTTTMEASRVLSLKTWQTAAWQIGAGSMLLRSSEAAGQMRHVLPSDAKTTAVTSAVNRSDEITHL